MTTYITTGAIRNSGDFLIHHRGRALLQDAYPRTRFHTWPRWKPLDDPSAEALVLCGGPGLVPAMYPDIFALTSDLRDLPQKVLPLALGLGAVVSDPDEFSFDSGSLEALRAVLGTQGLISVRDPLSARAVRQAGLTGVAMTGCVAWYEKASLGTMFRPPQQIRSMAFTPPAAGAHLPRALDVMRRVARAFPHAVRYCSFHRGILPGQGTSLRQSAGYSSVAAAAISLGYRVVDASGSVKAIGFYRDVDLHVGYRVHAHLDFVSRRRPSVLISEDIRGRGQSEALADPFRFTGTSPDLPEAVVEALHLEHSRGWPSTATAVDVIEQTWPTMREALDHLGVQR